MKYLHLLYNYFTMESLGLFQDKNKITYFLNLYRFMQLENIKELIQNF